MDIIIIGAGINGLVCANYLQRAGHSVTVLEKKLTPGGACCKATTIINGKEYEYPNGASVFGMMQDFVFDDTGLWKEDIVIRNPIAPDMIHFPDMTFSYIWKDVMDKLGDDIEPFHRDLAKVVKFFNEKVKIGKIPFDFGELGDLYRLWVSGCARDLLNRYFKSKYTFLYNSISVTESGPVDWDEPYSAFNIVLMNTGTVNLGKWGFVRDGIWSITEKLVEINERLGVHHIFGVDIISVLDKVVFCDRGCLLGEEIIFATDPITASKLSNVEIPERRYIGNSGKQIFFFDKPVELDRFHYIFDKGDYIELYPEGPLRRRAGWKSDYDYVCAFFKEGIRVEDLVRPLIGDWVGSVLLTSKELKEQFYFPGGNIDHMEICAGQTLWERTFSKTDKFYQFGDKYWYCGAGAFPCGSVAGTAGYLCAKELLVNK